MMYIESEFALLEAQNEQLTRENKTLVAALEVIYKDLDSFNFSTLSLDGLMGIAKILNNIKQALSPQECTCIPDLPDGRSRGVCYAHEADTTDEIPFDGR